jgi:hypothetical protein
MRQPVFPSAVQVLGCAAILSLAGCTGLLYDDRCGPESRDINIAERIRTAQGDSIGLAGLSLGESRDESTSQSVYWDIWGSFLRGHLESARLVASENTGTTLLSLSGGPAEPPDIVMEGRLVPYTGPVNFNQLFTRARTGGLTIVLETDIAGRQVIAVPLQQIVQFNDWGRAHCS